MHQKSFSDIAYDNKKKQTRKERFLELMDAVLPWDKLLAPLLKHYPKAGQGRRPVPVEVMLRIYFLQQWYGLSDPGMEDGLYDTDCLRRFAGIGIDQIPDETTILKFRHLLEKHDLTKSLFQVVESYLSSRGLLLSEGTIVDATIITAPASRKNSRRRRDEEMGSTKKGGCYYFGLKAHIGSDTKGLVHSVVITNASVHDSQVMDDCLHGEEKVIYGDKAYANASRREAAVRAGIDWRVNRKASRGRKLTAADNSFNQKSNKTRSMIEHSFGVIKHLWGYRKVRYQGLSKNAAQLFSLFALSNLYRARHEIMALTG